MNNLKSYKKFNESVILSINGYLHAQIINNGGYLYHVTTEHNAKNIIKYNYFRVSKGIAGLNGLSTTFDKNYFWGSSEVQFILSYDKLKDDFELKFIDEKLGINESEIKVLNNEAILNARKYISDIKYNGNNIEFQKEIDGYLNTPLCSRQN